MSSQTDRRLFDIDRVDASPFIIAEVGQNHQGSLETAREFIKVFAGLGADAVKFQVRNNKYLFSKEAYEATYNSENAFAETYGAHRESLELSIDDLPILKADCAAYGVHFMATPFDEPSLKVLCDVGVDILKVASFDNGNLPFLSKMAKAGKPVVLSIGGGNANEIAQSVNALQGVDDLAILHCVSEYPCEHDRLGLDNIAVLQKNFPNIAIGLSDHFNGILSGPVALLKGARVFEKHVTFNRAWKGTDHSFALEPEGFRRFVRDIRRVPDMMPPKPAAELGKEAVFKKLGKTIIASEDIHKGAPLTLDNLSGRIFGGIGIPVRQSGEILGKRANRDISAGELISLDDLTT